MYQIKQLLIYLKMCYVPTNCVLKKMFTFVLKRSLEKYKQFELDIFLYIEKKLSTSAKIIETYFILYWNNKEQQKWPSWYWTMLRVNDTICSEQQG